MEEEKSCSNIAVPLFFAGAAIGAVLGLLFAPASGKEVRESISNRVEALREQVDKLREKIHKSEEE